MDDQEVLNALDELEELYSAFQTIKGGGGMPLMPVIRGKVSKIRRVLIKARALTTQKEQSGA